MWWTAFRFLGLVVVFVCECWGKELLVVVVSLVRLWLQFSCFFFMWIGRIERAGRSGHFMYICFILLICSKVNGIGVPGCVCVFAAWWCCARLAQGIVRFSFVCICCGLFNCCVFIIAGVISTRGQLSSKANDIVCVCVCEMLDIHFQGVRQKIRISSRLSSFAKPRG